jgi:hypothetical protein
VKFIFCPKDKKKDKQSHANVGYLDQRSYPGGQPPGSSYWPGDSKPAPQHQEQNQDGYINNYHLLTPEPLINNV